MGTARSRMLGDLVPQCEMEFCDFKDEPRPVWSIAVKTTNTGQPAVSLYVKRYRRNLLDSCVGIAGTTLQTEWMENTEYKLVNESKDSVCDARLLGLQTVGTLLVLHVWNAEMVYMHHFDLPSDFGAYKSMNDVWGELLLLTDEYGEQGVLFNIRTQSYTLAYSLPTQPRRNEVVRSFLGGNAIAPIVYAFDEDTLALHVVNYAWNTPVHICAIPCAAKAGGTWTCDDVVQVDAFSAYVILTMDLGRHVDIWYVNWQSSVLTRCVKVIRDATHAFSGATQYTNGQLRVFICSSETEELVMHVYAVNATL